MARVAVYKNGAFRTVAGFDIPANHGRFKDSSNTGLPSGTVLGQPEGSLTVTTPGTIIEDRLFYGPVTVLAPDVTIRRCRLVARVGGLRALDAGAVPPSVLGNTYSLEVQDCDIDGGILGASSAVLIQGYTAIRRCRVRGAADGVKIGGTNALLEDSWVYEQVQYPGGHDDALQTTGGDNVIIRRNRLEVVNVEHNTQYNACLQIGSLQSNLTNMLVADNYLDGGTFMINGSMTSGGFTSSNVIFRGNRFGPNRQFGPVTGAVKAGAGVTWENTNVTDITGVPV